MAPESTNNGLALIAPFQNGLMTEEQSQALRTRLNNFTTLLNKKPAPKSIQRRVEGGSTYDYIPISFIEKDLNRCFFGLVQYELISQTQIFNEIVVTARIKVFHPVLNIWMNYDGIGSAVIMQDKDSLLMDFNSTKKKNAMKLAAPIAFAEAKKSAAKQIGARFGSDLNRKEGFVDEYTPFGNKQDEDSNGRLNG